MSYYSLEILTHTLKAGQLNQALSLAWRVARDRFGGQYRPVFGLSAAEVDQVPIIEVPDYRIECLSSWSDVDVTTRKVFREHRRYLWWDVRQLLTEGAKLWIGRRDGQVANLGWTRTGDAVRSYFFPVLPDWVFFSHFVTFPNYRRQGLYLAMLTHMIRLLAGEGVHFFLIDCTDWNLPSLRGIERAGFHPLGHGRVSRRGQLTWYQQSPPCPVGAWPRPRLWTQEPIGSQRNMDEAFVPVNK